MKAPKVNLICRDNILMPGQLQFVDPETGDLVATINANSETGKYTVAAMFIGFDKVGFKIKDETHLVTTEPEASETVPAQEKSDD